MALGLQRHCVSAIYLKTAWLLKAGDNDSQQLLLEAFLALGVAFLTLARAARIDARWNAATWAPGGARLVWVGMPEDFACSADSELC